jgi:hypothetical protein
LQEKQRDQFRVFGPAKGLEHALRGQVASGKIKSGIARPEAGQLCQIYDFGFNFPASILIAVQQKL